MFTLEDYLFAFQTIMFLVGSVWIGFMLWTVVVGAIEDFGIKKTLIYTAVVLIVIFTLLTISRLYREGYLL
jgi:hypothetical protein